MADNDEVRVRFTADTAEFIAGAEAVEAATAKLTSTQLAMQALFAEGVPVSIAGGRWSGQITEEMVQVEAAMRRLNEMQARFKAGGPLEEPSVKFNQGGSSIEDVISRANRFDQPINRASTSASAFQKNQTLGDPTVLAGERALMAEQEAMYRRNLTQLAEMVPEREAILKKLLGASTQWTPQISLATDRLKEAQAAREEAKALGLLGDAMQTQAPREFGAAVENALTQSNKAFISAGEVEDAFGEKNGKLVETARKDHEGFSEIVAARQKVFDKLLASGTATAEQLETAMSRVNAAEDALARGGPSVQRTETGPTFAARLDNDLIGLNRTQATSKEVAEAFGAAERDVTQVTQNTAKYILDESSALGTVTSAAGGATGAVEKHTGALRNNIPVTSLVTVGHEALSNRWSRIPATLSIFTQALFGLTAAQTLVAGAVVGLVAGLGYLIYKAIETERAMTELGNAFAMTGRGAEDSKQFAKDLNDELKNMDHVSSKAREKLLDFYASNAGLTREQITALQQLEGAYAAAFGDKGEAMVEGISKHLENLTVSTLPALDREYLGLGATQYKVIKDMLEAHDLEGAKLEVVKAQLAKQGKAYEDLDTQIKNMADSLDRAQQAKTRLLATNLNFAGDTYALMAAESAVDNYTKKLNELKSRKELSDKQDTDTKLKRGDDEMTDIVKKDDPRAKLQQQYTDAVNQSTLAEQALTAAQAKGDPAAIAKAQEYLNNAHAALNEVVAKTNTMNLEEQKKQGQDALNQTRTDVSQIQALGEGSRSAQLAQEAAKWQQVIQQHSLGTAEREEAERSYNAVMAQLSHENRRTMLTDLHDAVQEAKLGSLERIKAAEAEYAAIQKLNKGVTTPEGRNAKKDVTEAQAAYDDASSKAAIKATDDAIKQQDRELAAYLKHLDAMVRAHEMSAADRAQAEVAYTDKVMQTEEGLYDELIDLTAKDQEQHQAALDAKAAAEQKYADKVQAINDKAAADQEHMYETMLKPLSSGLDAAIRGAMSGRESMKNVMAGALRDMITQEAEAQVKILQQKAALYLMDKSNFTAVEAQKNAIAESENNSLLGALWRWLFGSKAVQTADVVSHGATETTKTAQTAAGVSARSAIQVSADHIMSADETAQVGIHAFNEMAKAAGTEAGVTAQVAATAEGQAVEDSLGAASAGKDAAKAAMGAYAAVSEIPLIGPVLAPAAAAVAYGAVMAYNVFDVGAWELPGDQIGLLHKGESIVPTPFAAGMRAALAGGGFSANDNRAEQHLHMSYSPTITVGPGSNMNRAEFSKLLQSHHGTMVGEVRNMMRKGWRP